MYNYGRNFWVLCWSMFLFMTSFNLIIPELNGFITSFDGEKYKGLIIAVFSLSALISRPFSGKLSDTIGRKRVMSIGMIISVLVCLLYPFTTSVAFFLCLRLLHGFSAGFFPTGATALLTDILPPNQRGRGMGVWGMFISLGFGVGQGFGSMISNVWGINTLFLIASGIAIFSGILLKSVSETLEEKQKFKPKLLKVSNQEIVEPLVLPAAIVMFLSATCSGIIFVLTPDISTYLKIENKGWFFIFYVLTTIFVRFFFSSVSDKIGRRKTLAIGMFFLIVSMVLICLSYNIILFSASAIIFGIATGISSPTLFSWTADLSHPERRGIGAGTMFIALELGIIVGASSTMFLYKNSMETIPYAVSIGVTFSLLAFFYLIWHINKRESLT